MDVKSLEAACVLIDTHLSFIDDEVNFHLEGAT